MNTGCGTFTTFLPLMPRPGEENKVNQGIRTGIKPTFVGSSKALSEKPRSHRIHPVYPSAIVVELKFCRRYGREGEGEGKGWGRRESKGKRELGFKMAFRFSCSPPSRSSIFPSVFSLLHVHRYNTRKSTPRSRYTVLKFFHAMHVNARAYELGFRS